jgi:hypothetical protein
MGSDPTDALRMEHAYGNLAAARCPSCEGSLGQSPAPSGGKLSVSSSSAEDPSGGVG